MPHVSVIMPCYQHAAFVETAIASVLSQRVDLELIVVDDGSTDGSAELVQRAARRDGAVRALLHGRNEGIARSFNDGLDAARGRYVAFLASDDAWRPGALARLLSVLEADDRRVVFGDALLVDEAGASSGLLHSEHPYAGRAEVQAGVAKLLSLPPEERARRGQELDACRGTVCRSGRSLLAGFRSAGLGYIASYFQGAGAAAVDAGFLHLICLSCLVTRREHVAAVRFDGRLRYANDILLLLELARRHEFCFVREPLLLYRIHGRNVSRADGRAGLVHSDRAGWTHDLAVMARYFARELALPARGGFDGAVAAAGAGGEC